MKKVIKLSIYLLSVLVLFSTFESCVDDFETVLAEDQKKEIATRSFNDGHFDWDRSDEFKVLDRNNDSIVLSLPWLEGSTSNLGIPPDWIDPNATITPNSERSYSRENGWVLVYSNMNAASEVNKYFALYHKYTGIIRFFFYTIGTETGSTGYNSTTLGINVNSPTSLFNFTTELATGINNLKDAPGYTFSPNIKLANGEMNNIGFKVNQWYGMEFECAYDPSISSTATFNILLWGTKFAKITGSSTTTGSINGTIVSTSPDMPNLSLQFGDHSNVKNSYRLTQDDAGNVVGEKIDKSISEGDNFFGKLWNNIKTNASSWITSGLESGAKKGLEAIMSSGGSVIGSALGGVFNSLIGKDKQKAATVSLDLKAESVFELESQEENSQWRISQFPVPGVRTNNPPLYNNHLGVWNLQETPKFKIHLYEYRARSIMGSYYRHTLEIEPSTIRLNPALESECAIKNFKQELLLPRYNIEKPNSQHKEELVSMEEHYNVGTSYRTETHDGITSSFGVPPEANNAKVRVTFDLYNKATNKLITSFNKCFDAVSIPGETHTEWEPLIPPGGR